jgi:hypothetical protein
LVAVGRERGSYRGYWDSVQARFADLETRKMGCSGEKGDMEKSEEIDYKRI